MKISLLIPFYNEVDTIREYDHMLFPIVDEIMREYKYDYEYVFMDDGSVDGSQTDLVEYITKSKQLTEKSVVLSHTSNRGLGKTIRDGIEECKGDYIIIMDADLSYRPASIRDMLECLKLNPDVDCISSSPYMYPHLVRGMDSNIRYWGSIYFNKVYSWIIGQNITCATSMFRLYKSNILKNKKLRSDGFDISAEILSKFILGGKKVIEIPVTLYGRDYGISKMKVIYETRRGIEMIVKIYLKKNFPNIYTTFFERV